jgi:hypothetical protein
MEVLFFYLFELFHICAQHISVFTHIRKIYELRAIRNYIPEQDSMSNNIFNTMKVSFENVLNTPENSRLKLFAQQTFSW